MDARELRIGSLVKDTIQDKIVRVSGILGNEIIHETESETTITADFKAIPLTEEWLLKFGFNSTEWRDVDGIEDNGFYHSESDILLNRDFQFSEHHKRVEIKHIHQLQNLYFALTGEELKIEQ